MELISRQLVIEVIEEYPHGDWNIETMSDMVERIKQLSPIQPVNNSEVPNSSDTISRQQAIDALKGCYCGGEDSCGEPWIYESHAIKAVEQLPPIQPEPHWIPVEQALPELRHDVLLTVFFNERWNVAEGYRQDGEFMFWNNGRLDSVLDEENRVIAWMTKPEPYKGVTT